MQNDCIHLYSSETQELQKYDTDEFLSFGSTHQFLWEKKIIQVKNALKSFKELKLFEGKEVTFFNSNFFFSSFCR